MAVAPDDPYNREDDKLASTHVPRLLGAWSFTKDVGTGEPFLFGVIAACPPDGSAKTGVCIFATRGVGPPLRPLSGVAEPSLELCPSVAELADGAVPGAASERWRETMERKVGGGLAFAGFTPKAARGSCTTDTGTWHARARAHAAGASPRTCAWDRADLSALPLIAAAKVWTGPSRSH